MYWVDYIYVCICISIALSNLLFQIMRDDDNYDSIVMTAHLLGCFLDRPYGSS